jgi:glycosyltransferase involved in cell wall biosynthesis
MEPPAALSVIVPCYRVASTLEAQLDALLAQEWDRPWELVCVDQPSTDGTRAILDRYAERFPNVRIVEAAERYNISYARNVGVAAAQGDLLLFCDGDDVVRPGWIAGLAAALEQAPIAAGALDSHGLNAPEIAASREELDPIQQWPGFLPHTAGGNMGVRRDLYERIGGFSEEPPSLEDTDFCFRAQLDADATIVAAPDAVLEYRFRSTPGAIFHQAALYAKAGIWLRERYEPRGMPPLVLRELIRAWLSVTLRAPTFLVRRYRYGYAWRLGYRVGQLRAIISRRYRPRWR